MERNNAISFSCLVVLIQLCSFCEADCVLSNVKVNVTSNIGLRKSQFWSAKAFSADQCAQVCVRRKPCRSFTYDEYTSICELNTGVRDDTPIRRSKGRVYSEFRWWPSDVRLIIYVQLFTHTMYVGYMRITCFIMRMFFCTLLNKGRNNEYFYAI